MSYLHMNIIVWLKTEIESWEEKANSSFESSYQDGLLDGRKECAENLLEFIKKKEG